MSFDRYDSLLGFFFQAEDGIRDLVRSRGLGDVYKRQVLRGFEVSPGHECLQGCARGVESEGVRGSRRAHSCLLYTSDAADERSSVDLGGRRIIKKKKDSVIGGRAVGNGKCRTRL